MEEALDSGTLTGTPNPLFDPYREEYLAAQKIGCVKRFVKYKPPKMPNRIVSDLLYRYFKFKQSEYGYAHPTPQTGFASVSSFFRDRKINYVKKIFDQANFLVDEYYLNVLNGAQKVSVDAVIANLNKTSSPGVPWNNKYVQKKDVLLDFGFAEYFYKYYTSLARNDALSSLWTVSQKYEVRSKDKLSKSPPSIRTFTGSSMEHVLAMNIFCLDFNNKFYTLGAKFDIVSFVGASKFFRGFDRIMRRLMRNPRGFALDASKFDQSISKELLDTQLNLRYRCLASTDPNDHLRLSNLYYQASNSMLVMEDGSIYQKQGGMPSGFANTIVDNTIILHRLLVYSYLFLAQGRRDVDQETFDSEIIMFLNGDDSLISAPDRLLSWWNPESITKVISDHFGINFTCEQGISKVEQLDFLNHRFQYDHRFNCFLPIPDTEKALTSLLYDKAKSHPLYTLIKLHALRIETWPILNFRHRLSELIGHWRTNFVKSNSSCLVGDTLIDFKIANSTYLDDRALEYLYTGLENGSALNVNSQIKFAFSIIESINEQ